MSSQLLRTDYILRSSYFKQESVLNYNLHTFVVPVKRLCAGSYLSNEAASVDYCQLEEWKVESEKETTQHHNSTM